MVLVMQLTRLDDAVLGAVSHVLEQCLGLEVLVSLEATQPPMVLYDWRRMQYRSDYLLEWLSRLRESIGGDLLVALGDIDAYVPGLSFVFGHASPETSVAAVYLRRLRPEFYGGMGQASLADRAAKEALHEVGHLLGLGHCSDERCVMRFSNTVNEVDRKKPAFCPRCASVLRGRGLSVRCVLEG